jgi:hypothetical protein
LINLTIVRSRKRDRKVKKSYTEGYIKKKGRKRNESNGTV